MTTTEFKAHGTITLTNWGGIEIMLNRSCDGVLYRFNFGDGNLDNAEIFESEIFYGYYTDNETEITDETEVLPYFIHNGTKYFLNQAIRTK